MSKTRTKVVCESGIRGWRDYLQANYEDQELWIMYSETYGLAHRLGYESAEEAWDDNPLIEGSVIPSDFRVVKQSLYQSLKEAGCVMSNHESDLYVEDTDTARSIIEKSDKKIAARFIDRVTQAPTLEVAFAFEPFFEAKRK